MKDLIKVQIEVKEQPNSAFYWLNRGEIEGCSIPKNLCTVIEGEKEEPKAIPYNEKLLIEMWSKRSPSHEYSQEGKNLFWKTAFMVFEDYLKALPNEMPAPEPKGWCIKRTPVKEEYYPGIQYQKLFNHILDAHGVTLVESEMQDIIHLVNEIKQVEVKEESEPERPIDKVAIEVLDSVLRMCNIQLHTALIDKIIDCVELIEDKKGEVNIADVLKMKQEWEVKRPVK